MLAHRDGHGSELVCSEPECLVGGHSRDSIQKRVPARLGRFIPDMRRMNETAADVGGTTPASLAREILPSLTRAASLPKR